MDGNTRRALLATALCVALFGCKPEPTATEAPPAPEPAKDASVLPPPPPPPPTCEELPGGMISHDLVFLDAEAGTQVILLDRTRPLASAEKDCFRARLFDLSTGKELQRAVVQTATAGYKSRMTIGDIIEREGVRYLWLRIDQRNYLYRADNLQRLLDATAEGLGQVFRELKDNVVEVAVRGEAVFALAKNGEIWRIDPFAGAIELQAPGVAADAFKRWHRPNPVPSCDAGIVEVETASPRYAKPPIEEIECPRCRLRWDRKAKFTAGVFLEPRIVHPKQKRDKKLRACVKDALGKNPPKLVFHRKDLTQSAPLLASRVADSGATLWTRELPVHTEPERMSGDLVILLTGMGVGYHARVLDMKDGRTRWQYPSPEASLRAGSGNR